MAQHEPKLYTESEFTEINGTIEDLRQALDEQAHASQRVENLRARLLELVSASATEDDKAVLPGVQVVTSVKYEVNEQEVLDWAFADAGSLMAAAPLLTVGPDITALIVGMAVQDPSYRKVLTINPGAVNKAISAGLFSDLPHGDPIVSRTVRITPRNLKTGQALRDELDVIPDDVLDETAEQEG